MNYLVVTLCGQPSSLPPQVVIEWHQTGTTTTAFIVRGQLYFSPPQQSFVVEWHQTDTTTDEFRQNFCYDASTEILVWNMEIPLMNDQVVTLCGQPSSLPPQQSFVVIEWHQTGTTTTAFIVRGQLYFSPPQQSFVVEWHQTDTTTTDEFRQNFCYDASTEILVWNMEIPPMNDQVVTLSSLPPQQSFVVIEWHQTGTTTAFVTTLQQKFW